MSNLIHKRLNYLESVARASANGDVQFNDPFNKFLDEVLLDVDANTDAIEANAADIDALEAVNAARVSVSGYLSGPVTLTTAGTAYKLTGWTEERDTGNNFASDRFTATLAQAVDVDVSVAFNVAADGNRLRLYIRVNGENYRIRQTSASGPATQSVPIRTTIVLGVGDYIEFWASNLDATDSIAGGQGSSYFTISTNVVP